MRSYIQILCLELHFSRKDLKKKFGCMRLPRSWNVRRFRYTQFYFSIKKIYLYILYLLIWLLLTLLLTASWVVMRITGDDKSMPPIQNNRVLYMTRRPEPIGCISKKSHKYNPSTRYFCLDWLATSKMGGEDMSTSFPATSHSVLLGRLSIMLN